jgi:hypothetical protein
MKYRFKRARIYNEIPKSNRLLSEKGTDNETPDSNRLLSEDGTVLFKPVQDDDIHRVEHMILERLPNGVYIDKKSKNKVIRCIYVITANGELRIADARYRHDQLANGKLARYAGELIFDKDGRLKNWNNNSGHYSPCARMKDTVLQIIQNKIPDATKENFKDASRVYLQTR